MTWTYSGDPSSSDGDAVRFLIGDTDSGDKQILDEEIAWLLSENGSVYSAAAAAAGSLAAKYARKVDKSVGDLRLAMNQKYEHYKDLASQLKSKIGQLAIPFAGGISKGSKDGYEAITDRVEPAFTRELHAVGATVDD